MEIPRFPDAMFFPALLLVIFVGWIILSALVSGKRWVELLSWIILSVIAVVSLIMTLSGAFVEGAWFDYEPSRAGATWLFSSALLAGYLLVKKLLSRH